MSDTLVMLQLEHRSYWKILDLLDGMLDQLEAGEGANANLLGLIFEYFTEYPDRCHHPKEDLVYRRLSIVDRKAAEEVGDLLGDHAALARITWRASEAVAEARAVGGVGERSCLEAMRQFSRAYREHIRAEEKHFIPMSLELLSRDDVDLIDFSMFESLDPIFDEAAEGRFARLRQAILHAADADGESAAD